MSTEYNPLGNFNISFPLHPEALSCAKTFLNMLPGDPKPGDITRMYEHWTVSGYSCDFTDYNVEAKQVEGKWTLALEHNPLDDISGYNNDPEIAGTWRRNTGSVAIAITGMDGATENNFGDDPITVEGLEYLCAGSAALALKYHIDINGNIIAPGSTHLDNNGNNVNTTGEHNVLTHAEVAVIDSYPSERWDLGVFTALPSNISLTSSMRSQCGDAIRARIRLYKIALGH